MMFRLSIDYRERVWGGQRLRPGANPIGEAWIVHEGNRVVGGPYAGRTLADVSNALGAELLGFVPLARTGNRFPLLIKILDCQDWLSVQVHPNDEEALRLEGPGHFGKTEAWSILESAPGARLIAGVKAGTNRAALAAAIQNGTVLDVAASVDVEAGDTVLMPAGTLHALGPGLLVYEVQQTSDITYRVWDWDRPAAAGRSLHVAQSIAVTDPAMAPGLLRAAAARPGEARELGRCPYFVLESRTLSRNPVACDTARESFHAVTAVEGQIEVSQAGQIMTLDRFESVVLPAFAGPYLLRGAPSGKVLTSRVAA
ncbi:MAG: type I phosphomannose isomerase catalytic subunit [Thermoflexales bacterium]